MYLHLGQDYIVPLQNVVAVFDMDTATVSGRTQRLLSRLQDEGRIIELYDDLPRAAVLCESALRDAVSDAAVAAGAPAQSGKGIRDIKILKNLVFR